jgi:hypothetical protein
MNESGKGDTSSEMAIWGLNGPDFRQIGIRQLDLNDGFMRSIWDLIEYAKIRRRPTGCRIERVSLRQLAELHGIL